MSAAIRRSSSAPTAPASARPRAPTASTIRAKSRTRAPLRLNSSRRRVLAAPCTSLRCLHWSPVRQAHCTRASSSGPAAASICAGPRGGRSRPSGRKKAGAGAAGALSWGAGRRRTAVPISARASACRGRRVAVGRGRGGEHVIQCSFLGDPHGLAAPLEGSTRMQHSSVQSAMGHLALPSRRTPAQERRQLPP